MTRTFAFTAFATVLTLSAAPAVYAGNAGASLGECYNHVISACNQTNHPESCSEAGMDACDELHATAVPMPGTQIKIFDRGNGKFKARLIPQQTPRPQGNDDDDRAEREPTRDQGREAGRSVGPETRDPTGGRG